MQLFLGKIIFVIRFVPSFSEMVRPLQNMIKRDFLFKWGSWENKSFNTFKKDITEAPSFMSLNFTKAFTLYNFELDRSYAIVLTQKNNDDNEIYISFMSSTLKEKN